jgi:hypothetical protein
MDHLITNLSTEAVHILCKIKGGITRKKEIGPN